MSKKQKSTNTDTTYFSKQPMLNLTIIGAVITSLVGGIMFFKNIVELSLAAKVTWIALLIVALIVFTVVSKRNRRFKDIIAAILSKRLEDKKTPMPTKTSLDVIQLVQGGIVGVIILFVVSIFFVLAENQVAALIATKTPTPTSTTTSTQTLTPTFTSTATLTSTATATFTATPIRAKSRYYMIVLDASRNMNEPFGDGAQTKWDAALNSVRYMLKALDDDANFGLVAVGGQGEDATINPCDAPTAPLIPFISQEGNLLPSTGFPKQGVITQLDQLKPSGGGAFDEAFIVAKKQLENLPPNTTNMLLYFTGASDTCESENEWNNLTRIIKIANDLASYREIIVLTEKIEPEVKAFADFVNQLSANTNIQVPQDQQELNQSVTVALEQVEVQAQEQARDIASAQPPPLTPFTPIATRTPTRTPTFGPSLIPPSQTPLPPVSTSEPIQWLFTSPDGRYGVKLIYNCGTHYQVIEIQSNLPKLTTVSKYRCPIDPNIVKTGGFSGDSSKFAAAYHYSDNGDYTWIGVWNIVTGEFYEKVKDGFTTDLSGVFDGP